MAGWVGGRACGRSRQQQCYQEFIRITPPSSPVQSGLGAPLTVLVALRAKRSETYPRLRSGLDGRPPRRIQNPSNSSRASPLPLEVDEVFFCIKEDLTPSRGLRRTSLQSLYHPALRPRADTPKTRSQPAVASQPWRAGRILPYRAKAASKPVSPLIWLGGCHSLTPLTIRNHSPSGARSKFDTV